MSDAVLAALDCGTNSTRLLIETAGGKVLAREMRITRLGQGVDATGRLADEAVERTLSVLRTYRELMDGAGVSEGRLVATSAARDAANGPAFLVEASTTTGVTAEILTGDEEGELSFNGATADLEPALGDDVVLDIGGGSTELVLRRGPTLFAHSMQVGCVRVTERVLTSDPPTPAELESARVMVGEALDRAFVAIPALSELHEASRLIGLAGTVATLVMIDRQLVDYDRRLVHHHWLSLEAIRQWLDVLAAEPAAARALRPGMVPGREDVIVGGLVVLVATLERLGLDGCLSSEADILDGLISSQRR